MKKNPPHPPENPHKDSLGVTRDEFSDRLGEAELLTPWKKTRGTCDPQPVLPRADFGVFLRVVMRFATRIPRRQIGCLMDAGRPLMWQLTLASKIASISLATGYKRRARPVTPARRGHPPVPEYRGTARLGHGVAGTDAALHRRAVDLQIPQRGVIPSPRWGAI